MKIAILHSAPKKEKKNIAIKSPKIIRYLNLSAQSSLSICFQKYLSKCEDTYFILQNKFLHIYTDSFETKILRNDCVLICTLVII